MQVNYFADCSLEFLDDPSALAMLEVLSLMFIFAIVGLLADCYVTEKCQADLFN